MGKYSHDSWNSSSQKLARGSAEPLPPARIVEVRAFTALFIGFFVTTFP